MVDGRRYKIRPSSTSCCQGKEDKSTDRLICLVLDDVHVGHHLHLMSRLSGTVGILLIGSLVELAVNESAARMNIVCSCSLKVDMTMKDVSKV